MINISKVTNKSYQRKVRYLIMEVVKIGLREVDKELFINAVANNDSLTHILEAIGFNPIPTTNRHNVENLIAELNLPTDHIKAKKKINLETYKANEKQFNLNEDNKQYLDSFLPSLSDNSRATYKASCGNFLETLGSQDFMKANSEQVVAFANTKNSEAQKANVTAHIKSMMVYCVNNDVNGAIDKVSKQMLVWLIRK